MINDQRTHREEQPAVNLGQARKKEETKEEKRARKQQIKEARKVCEKHPPSQTHRSCAIRAKDVLTPGTSLYVQANRERKKEIKGAFKEEELRQLNMQAKGQGQRVIRLK
jgi:hypothetical protein